MEKYRVCFKIPAHYHTKSVEIVGDFNHWKPGHLQLEDDDGDNTWWGETHLPSGRYHYKVLIDGEHYQTDSTNPLVEERDGHHNSVLVVGRARFQGEVLHSTADIDYYCHQCFYLHAGFDHAQFLGIRLLMVINDVNYTFTSNELYRDEVYAWHYFHSSSENYPSQTFLYYFELTRLDHSLAYFGRNGLCASEWEIEHFEATHPGKGTLDNPQWVRDAVFYQIFPERFAQGDPTLHPDKLAAPHSLPGPHSFYGGDLEGVIQHLDHLEDLGINALYFNPLFQAPSNHKYDTSDYEKIDPHFGNEQTFKKLNQAIKTRGWRYILDAVFNHTGTEFWAWRDIVSKQDKSEYLDWYRVHKFPLMEDGKPNYACWWNFPSLPELNVEDNRAVWDYLLKVARQWIEAGADGWRLDVPNEIEHPFWKDFRSVVKQANPQAFILGEIWQAAQEWLQGDEFDSVMNYRFRDACVEFFAQRKSHAEDFVKLLGRQIYDYPMQANFSMFNLLSSHDTARFLTIAGGDRKRIRLAVAFQFTYLGVPSVYYGEEIGLEGAKDPDNRRMMPWDRDKWDEELLQFYRDMIRLRRANPVLSHGNLSFFLAHKGVVGMKRFDEQETLYILFNNSEENVNVDITLYAGNGEFLDISKDYPLKRKKAYTLYANDFAVIKKQ